VVGPAREKDETVTVFESLLVAHIVGDWLLQTEWQAVEKARHWRAMWAHVFVYHSVVLCVLVAHFGFRDFRVYVIVVLLALSHAILDRGWPVLRLMRILRVSVERPNERWLTVAFDQSVHIVLIALATLYLTS